MKVGDLVWDSGPGSWANAAAFGGGFKKGILISELSAQRFTGNNKVFKVLWADGTIGNNVWDYDLRLLNENSQDPFKS